MEKQPQLHTIAPVYDENSRILILGSFPSVKSREAAFFYGHPQNRFWRVMARVLGCETPGSVPEKAAMLHAHHIALWDVIASCDISGSSDSSIRNVVPSDIASLVKDCPDIRIFGNGDAACRLYRKYCQESVGKDITRLPSTSPANAACRPEMLRQVWGTALADWITK